MINHSQVVVSPKKKPQRRNLLGFFYVYFSFLVFIIQSFGMDILRLVSVSSSLSPISEASVRMVSESEIHQPTDLTSEGCDTVSTLFQPSSVAASFQTTSINWKLLCLDSTTAKVISFQ